MKHLFMRMLFMLAVLAAFGESAARADLVAFSYGWAVQPGAVLPAGTGSVQIALAPNGTSSYLMGSSTPALISGATLTTSSTATAGAPDSFNNPFSLKLSLKDSASNATGDLTFSGTIAGSLTLTSSTLTSTFSNPLTQSLTLGSHIYSVTIDPSVLGLPKPGADSNALLDALITVRNLNGGTGGTGGTGGNGGTGGTPSPDAPEPSSLVLGGMALTGLAVRRWSRLKRSA